MGTNIYEFLSNLEPGMATQSSCWDLCPETICWDVHFGQQLQNWALEHKSWTPEIYTSSAQTRILDFFHCKQTVHYIADVTHDGDLFYQLSHHYFIEYRWIASNTVWIQSKIFEYRRISLYIGGFGSGWIGSGLAFGLVWGWTGIGLGSVWDWSGIGLGFGWVRFGLVWDQFGGRFRVSLGSVWVSLGSVWISWSQFEIGLGFVWDRLGIVLVLVWIDFRVGLGLFWHWFAIEI